MMNDQYLALKADFIKRITENNTCTDIDQQRRNLRKLREEVEEHAERRNAGLLDFDVYADEQTRNRVLAKVQMEKQALDDAVDELIVNGKLSLEREAFTALSRKTGLSRRTTNLIQQSTTGLVKYILTHLVGLLASVYIAPTIGSLLITFYGTGTLILQLVFQNNTTFEDIISYTLREIPAAFRLLVWPINEELNELYFKGATFWGIILYLAVTRQLLSKRTE